MVDNRPAKHQNAANCGQRLTWEDNLPLAGSRNVAAGFFFAVFFLLTSLAAAAEPPRSMSDDALHSGVYVDRAVIAYGDGRYEDALKELQQALKLDPENVD